MASPQKENGYTATAHELIEAFCRLQISGGAHRVLRVIERKTYGFNKKTDFISISQFQKYTHLDRRTVTRALDELEKCKIILVERSQETNQYTINKDYDTWVGAETPLGAKMSITRGENAPRTRGENAIYKRNKTIIKTIGDKSQKCMKSYNENTHSDEIPSIDMDSRQEIKPPEKAKRNYKEVYAVFVQVFDKPHPSNWIVNATQQKCAENLYTERGLEQIRTALEYYKEHKGEEYLPVIDSPYDLDTKWTKLFSFKKKNG